MIRHARAYLAAVVETCGRWRVLHFEALQLTGAALEAVLLALLIPLIEILAGSEGVRLPLVGWRLDATGAFVAVAVVVLLRAGTQWLTATMGSDLRIRTTDGLRLQALRGVLDAEWTYLMRQRRSAIVQATTTEVERAEAALAILLRIGVELCLLAATATVALAISPLVGGVGLVALIAVAAIGRQSVRRSVGLGVEWTRRNALFGAAVTDSLASLRLVRAHDAADQWAQLLKESAARGRAAQHRFVETSSAVQAALGAAGVGVALALVIIGRATGLGVAELITLTVVITRLLATARTVLQSSQTFANLAPALDAIRRLIAETASHREPAASGDVSATQASGDHLGTGSSSPLVELRRVTAGYGEQPVLHGLDLAIPPRGLVAVTGPSGAGKSTLLDVILGLLPPAEGELLVHGRPLADLRAWRQTIGYVPQQNVLIPASVRENLTWSANRPLSDADLWESLELACAADIVRGLPEGLETVLDDIAQLSGGEQQRLCLARAVARRPDLLVLDEGTSALDAVTERAVLDRLLRRPCTTVIATHRPAVSERADLVVRLGHLRTPDQFTRPPR